MNKWTFEGGGRMTLADRIAERISKIPSHNPMYISSHPETLRDILSAVLIRQIAKEAADEAEKEI